MFSDFRVGTCWSDDTAQWDPDTLECGVLEKFPDARFLPVFPTQPLFDASFSGLGFNSCIGFEDVVSLIDDLRPLAYTSFVVAGQHD